MLRSFGPVEILLILGVVLLLFGASRLPQMGLSLGKGLREFKRGITMNVVDEEPSRKQVDEPIGTTTTRGVLNGRAETRSDMQH